jgi:hypothetical protein
MGSETITITVPSNEYWADNTMNSVSGVDSADFGTIVLTGAAGVTTLSDTITFSGLDEYVNVTKAEHTELVDRVAKLEAMLTQEAELRANHPAVKQAYDEYRLLLVLAKQHTPAILTDE